MTNSLNRDREDLKERLVLDISAIVRNNYIDPIDALEQAVKIVDNFSKTIIQEAKAEERKSCLEALPKKETEISIVDVTNKDELYNKYRVQVKNQTIDQAISAITNKK